MSAGEYDEYAILADLYDHISLYRERADISFYVDAAKAARGPVLELGCGTGRILIPAARAGVEITGLDFSQRMSDVCRKQVAGEPAELRSRVHLVRGDMRNFTLGRSFRLITIPFRPFQHLTTVADQLACLASIRGHLDDHGRLILDVFNPSLEYLVNRPAGQEFDEGPAFLMPDGRRILRRYKILSYDRFNQVNQIEFLYDVTHPGGRQERLTDSFAFRYLFRFEVEHLLARAGFEVERLYGDFDKSEYGSKYPGELIFVARKTGAA